MCIAVPGRVLSIDDRHVAVVEISGARHEVSLDLIDEEVTPGDYVISHAGFAIHRIDEDAARENLALLKELTDHEIY
jgi:hydrogenase expression/formation protein HypC